MELITYIAQETQIDASSLALFNDIFSQEELKKGQTILQEGSNSKKVFFIEKGITRIFYQKEGKDITQMFFGENMFYAPTESIFFGKNGTYNFETLAKTTLRVANYNTLKQCIDEHFELQKLMQFILITNIKMFSQQLYHMRFHSASERYRILLEEHPLITQQVPLGHIASYLGITQQTLSVIRGNM